MGVRNERDCVKLQLKFRFGRIFYVAPALRLQARNGKLMWVCLSVVHQYVIEACMPWEMCTGRQTYFHDKTIILSTPVSILLQSMYIYQCFMTNISHQRWRFCFENIGMSSWKRYSNEATPADILSVFNCKPWVPDGDCRFKDTTWAQERHIVDVLEPCLSW